MGAFPTLCQATHYFAPGFPGMWKSPRWVKLCHQQSLPYPKAKGGWQPFLSQLWAHLCPPSKVLSPCGPRQVGFPDMPTQLSLLTCTRQALQACTSVAGMCTQSTAHQSLGGHRAEVTVRCRQHSRTLLRLSALPLHCWDWVSHLHPFHFKPKIQGYPLNWISSLQEATQLK